MSKKKFKKQKRARKDEKVEWKFLDTLHKASIKLDDAEAHAARSMINWHREQGYLTHRQKTYAANLISKVNARERKEVTKLDKTHYLYAISDGINVKLGFSINPQARLKGLQTGHPDQLKVVWKMACGDSPATAKQAERKLHRYCKAHSKHGEWFGIDCMILVNQFELKRTIDTERKEELTELEIVEAARQRLGE